MDTLRDALLVFLFFVVLGGVAWFLDWLTNRNGKRAANGLAIRSARRDLLAAQLHPYLGKWKLLASVRGLLQSPRQ